MTKAIATLISDFGVGDNSVAIAKGILLSHEPEMCIIDISHAVTPHNLIQCSYLFNSAFRYFPIGSIHISLFDVMHQLPAKVLLAQVDHQFIITADNGFLNFTFPDENLSIWQYEQSESYTYLDWLNKVAELVVKLNEMAFVPSKMGLSVFHSDIIVKPVKPIVSDQFIECHILHIDRYGNVVLNLKKEQFEALRRERRFKMYIPSKDPIQQITGDYANVREGLYFCMFNSAGYLEIGIKNSSAAQLLGLKMYHRDQLIYSTVKIEFFD